MFVTRGRPYALLMFASLLLVGCSKSHPATAPSPDPSVTSPSASASAASTSATSTPSPSPVPPPQMPTSPPPAQGAATATCLGGWYTPAQGSALWNFPLGVIRRTSGEPGQFAVANMRYFAGPESPPSAQTYLAVVKRWYVKAYLRRDPAFQGRFLVEQRQFGSGVSAVAPWSTTGFRSPDWVGFQWSNTPLKSYPGLPGEWRGSPYDFVKGGGGLNLPGLPSKVAGCMNGT